MDIEFKREYTAGMFETLKGMYKSHDFPVVNLTELPVFTYTVKVNGDLAYAIPVYMTDSGIAWAAFPVSNKFLEVSREQKKDVLSKLLNFISYDIKGRGKTTLFTTTGINYLKEVFEESGFTPGDKGIDQFFKQ